MAAEDDSVVDKIKSKVSSAREKAGGAREDPDADIDYEPAPEQEILADGMVVLGKDQVTGRDADDATGDGGARTDS